MAENNLLSFTSVYNEKSYFEARKRLEKLRQTDAFVEEKKGYIYQDGKKYVVVRKVLFNPLNLRR